MSISDEGGLRDHRTEFVREEQTEDGDAKVPENPEFELFSDIINSIDWSPGPGLNPQRGIGDADPIDHEKGIEEHQLTVTYDLQRWFVDGDDPADAAYDGIYRDEYNRLPNSHTVVDREDKGHVAGVSTVEGEGPGRESRIYTVGHGGHIDTATLVGDPGEQNTVEVTLDYEFEIVRSYQIDQPEEPTQLEIEIETADDEGLTLTIESDDGQESEEITLSGPDTTTAEFGSIDAAWLDDDPQGTITISEVDGPTLMEIKGAEDYDGANPVEGDRGVPALGDGSRAEPIATGYESFLGDTIERGDDDLAFQINSLELEVENNLDRTVREDSYRQRVHVGERNTNVTATTLGETESHGKIEQALANEKRDITWHMSGGNLVCPDAVLEEPGSRTIEAGQASMQLDNTFDSRGVEIE